VRGGPAVPSEAARALVEAALEAARNARRHGGGAGGTPDIGVEVGPTPDGTGLQVVVHDDGVGFDPALVPPHRMGLAVSVLARMDRVGGHAEIVTATGSGTTVRLSWRPPAGDGGAGAALDPLSAWLGSREAAGPDGPASPAGPGGPGGAEGPGGPGGGS
jgi:two-component sensor histidine kinase